MPENAVYLQAAFAITALALALYVAYVVLRLRQAQDELRALREQRRAAAARRDAVVGNALRTAEEPPSGR